MELIYTKDNFQIFADPLERSACIVRGDSKLMLDLEPLISLSPLEAKNIRLMGQSPADFLHIGHSCHILPKAASEAWEEVLLRAERAKRALDTSMIPLFKQNLPALAEIREVEDLQECMPSNMNMYFDVSESIVGIRTAEVRRRHPRETLYVQAERMAMSSDEQRTAAARSILVALIRGKEVPMHELKLLEGDAPERNRPSRSHVSAV